MYLEFTTSTQAKKWANKLRAEGIPATHDFNDISNRFYATDVSTETFNAYAKRFGTQAARETYLDLEI